MQKKFGATVLRNGFFLKAALGSVLLIAMIAGVTGCNNAEPSPENSILGILLEDQAGDAVWIGSIEINEELATVTLTVSPGKDVSALIPVLQLSDGAAIVSTANAGAAVNFTRPQTFRIQAEDGSIRAWTVRVTDLTSDGLITGVNLTDGSGISIWKEGITIDPDKRQILIEVAPGTDLTGITPELSLSPGAKLLTEIPEEGLDFNQAQTFTVEAQDGTTQEWTVAVKKSGEKDITGIISLNNGSGPILVLSSDIDTDTKKFILTVPVNTDLSTVKPELKLSPGAELIPGIPEEGLDFSFPQTFTVKAQDGTEQQWMVSIIYETSSLLELKVELAGTYDIKFGFSYPNHKENGGVPDYTPYDYDIKAGNPIKLSYFVTDNAIYAGSTRKTYYNTLVVSAAGFSDVTWRIDGRTAPTNNSTDAATDNILTIRAQDWSLENTHTVVFVGTLNKIKYSGTFEFKVVEIEEEAAE
jgi:hypothetical protein